MNTVLNCDVMSGWGWRQFEITHNLISCFMKERGRGFILKTLCLIKTTFSQWGDKGWIFTTFDYKNHY